MIRNLKLYLRALGAGGFLKAVAAKARKSTTLARIELQDCDFPFWLRAPSSDVPTYKKVFLDKEYDFLVESDPEVIVDAGANIGLVSIYLASKYPGARIISIEPEKSNFQLLTKNVAPYPNVHAVQAALWSKNEEIDLTDPGLGKWGFRTGIATTETATREMFCHRVPGMTVAKVMRDFGLEKIDILKVDIEGAEKEVFRDTRAWIEKVDSIIAELHDYRVPGCNRSFYCGTGGFSTEWRQGENVYLSRGTCLIRRHA
jgi:FkbM family methyltransferase